MRHMFELLKSSPHSDLHCSWAVIERRHRFARQTFEQAVALPRPGLDGEVIERRHEVRSRGRNPREEVPGKPPASGAHLDPSDTGWLAEDFTHLRRLAGDQTRNNRMEICG